ncbi:hypothetical protein LP420_01420 [Massilia sp. B-10]|nr:hypothetical protein LP420_01420 [Massilia sp. B-10]UUZ54723.1 hypothetical protein LP419_01290 [Massilia sp. H-1]
MVIAIVGVLAGMLLSRLVMYQEQAEMAAMENTLGILRSSLALRSGQLVANGQGADLIKLLTVNPMDLLAQKPSNYVGEYYSPQKAKISPGNWYFNRKKFLLVYIKRTGATPQA